MGKTRTKIGWLMLLILTGLIAWLYWPGDTGALAIEKAGGTVQRLTIPELHGEAAIALPDSVGDEDLERMTALDHLRPAWLQLRGRQLTGRGLASLKRLNCLRGLTLYGTSIKDGDLVHLEALPQLNTLILDGNTITDQGLETLAKLPQLRTVSLRGNPISASAVQRLQTARPELTVLSQFEPEDD